MQKSIFFIFMNIYFVLLYSAYSAPVLLFPNLAEKRSLNNFLIALVFSAFPLGSFPSAMIAGKLMRFYKKDKLLLFFNIFCSLTRILSGFIYFIEDERLFFVFAFLARFGTGVTEGFLKTICYSYIPDVFPDPDEMMKKYGILCSFCSLGIMIGSPLALLLDEITDYFYVFALMGSANLIFGTFIIVIFLKSDDISIFKISETESLPIMKACFTSRKVLLDSFYLFVFWLPTYMIMPGYETYMENLVRSTLITGIVYSLNFAGLVFTLFFIKYKYGSKILFVSGIIIMIGLMFFGPDPVFRISNDTSKIILIGFSFFLVSVANQAINLILAIDLINDLVEVFPNEKELCTDFSNGLIGAFFSLDELLGPIFGSLVNEWIGYEKTGTFFAILFLLYFVFYWCLNKKTVKIIMNDEQESCNSENAKY